MRYTGVRLLLGVLIASAPAAALATNVTACSSDTQIGSGTNLATALSMGGDVFIRCPSGTRLNVTVVYYLGAATQIIGSPTDSGSSPITLDGSALRGVMLTVSGGIKITLQNLRLTNFTIGTDYLKDPVGIIAGSAGLIGLQHMPKFVPTIIHSHSDVELDQVTIDASRDPVGVSGNLTVTGSTFRNNLGNALVANGIVLIDHSNFSQNERGILLHAGNIKYSQFDHNTTRAVDILFPEGQVTLRDSTFTANGGIAVAISAQASPNGGGSVLLRNDTFGSNISTSGALTIATETFPPQIPATDPGALALARLPAGSVQVLYSNFVSNSGSAGAIMATVFGRQGALELGGDAFLNNRSTALTGAAVSVTGALLTISHSLFKANTGVEASAVSAGAIAPTTISNSLFVENVSSGGAADAAAILAVKLTLSNVTIANNQETGVRANPSVSLLTSVTLSNVVLDGNLRSCDLGSGITLKGANLVFPDDHGCPGATIIEDPVLDSFYIPSPGSPALVQGDIKVCAAAPVSARDIVFQKRTDATCALGAFERPPPRFFVKPTPDGLAQLGRAAQNP